MASVCAEAYIPSKTGAGYRTATWALAFRADDRLQPSRQLGHNKQTHPVTQKLVFLIHREKEKLVFVSYGQAKQPLTKQIERV